MANSCDNAFREFSEIEDLRCIPCMSVQYQMDLAMRIFASTGKIMSDELVITRDQSSENRAWSEKMERQADSKEFDHGFQRWE